MRRALFTFFAASILVAMAIPAHAIEVRVSAPALERTLKTQLFTIPGPSGKPERYFLKGSATTTCGVYADDPHVSFKDDRVVVKLRTHSKLGTAIHGACVGISLNTEAEVSFIPEAEGESIGFRDARIDHLSQNKELDFLLVPSSPASCPRR